MPFTHSGPLPLPRLHLLGDLRLSASDAATGATLQYRKGWALLGYLAVERGRRHAREQLAGLFWPELETGAARTNLRQVLNDLQQAFRTIGLPGLINADKISISLLPPERTDILFDIDLLDPLLVDEEDVVALLADSPVWQHRGAFLQGIDIAGSSEFEDWLQYTRDHFLQREIRLMCRLRDHHARTDRSDAAAEVARRITRIDPWNEEHHRTLMRILADAGQRHQAHHVYADLERKLRRELNCEPSGETRALFAQLAASPAIG